MEDEDKSPQKISFSNFPTPPKKKKPRLSYNRWRIDPNIDIPKSTKYRIQNEESGCSKKKEDTVTASECTRSVNDKVSKTAIEDEAGTSFCDTASVNDTISRGRSYPDAQGTEDEAGTLFCDNVSANTLPDIVNTEVFIEENDFRDDEDYFGADCKNYEWQTFLKDTLAESTNWDTECIQELLETIDYELNFDDDDFAYEELHDDFCEDEESQGEFQFFDDELYDKFYYKPDQPLYDGADITQQTSFALCLSLAKKHRFTYSAFSDTLKVIQEHLPKPNCFAPSVYRLNKCLKDSDETLVSHTCCGICFRIVEGNNCESPSCIGKDQRNRSELIEIPIEEQIKSMFKDDEEFVEKLKYRFQRQSKEGTLKDIQDGTEYKALFSQGKFLWHPFNMTVMLNTDGTSPKKSSKISVWPVFLSINELPPNLRFRKKYMILAALWCSTDKPPMYTLLKPVIQRLKLLSTEGIDIVTFQGNVKHSKVMLLLATFDLPAKAMVLHFHQYNGECGCAVFEEAGLNVSIGRGHTRVYPYNQFKQRTQASVLSNAEEALVNNKKHVKGVKGYSVLHLLHPFDVVGNVVVDYMHCVLLGVVRKLLSTWFNSCNHKHAYYIGTMVAVVDSMLVSIKPPDSVGRTPRSVDKYRKLWKASECKNWLLYYSLPILRGVLPDKFWSHYALLVGAMHILLGDDVDVAELEIAEVLLENFCYLFQAYYALKHCTINIHSLRHLVWFVRKFGPLWTHSCFWFESMNGQLMRLLHGNSHVAMQIMSSLAMSKHVPAIVKNLSDSTPQPVLQLLQELTGHKSASNTMLLFPGCSAVGTHQPAVLTEEISMKLNHLLISYGIQLSDDPSVFEFKKVILHGETIFSEACQNVQKRNSYTIIFKDEKRGSKHFGLVKKFISVHDRDYHIHLALVAELQPSRLQNLFASLDDVSPLVEPYLEKLSQIFTSVDKFPEKIHPIPISNILGKCVYMEVRNSTFVCKFPNTIEGD